MCSYLFINGSYAAVPASRSAVFKDRSLSPADKRLLTRFLMQLASTAGTAPFPQVLSQSYSHNCCQDFFNSRLLACSKFASNTVLFYELGHACKDGCDAAVACTRTCDIDT